MAATLFFMLGFCFLHTPIPQNLELLYLTLTLQCGQSSIALALCAAASALFALEDVQSGVGSTERAGPRLGITDMH